jgi:hypothetical protein
MRWWIGLCLGVLLCTATIGYTDDRRGSPFPTDEHWEGSRTWRPDRDRDWRGRAQELPDRFTIDKPGKCEVICERVGRQYKCREQSSPQHPLHRWGMKPTLPGHD